MLYIRLQPFCFCFKLSRGCSSKFSSSLLAPARGTYLGFPAKSSSTSIRDNFLSLLASMFAFEFPKLCPAAQNAFLTPGKSFVSTRRHRHTFQVSLVGAGQTSCCIVLPQTVPLKPPNWATPSVTRELAQTQTKKLLCYPHQKKGASLPLCSTTYRAQLFLHKHFLLMKLLECGIPDRI